jgi:hypothetical protein
MLHVPHNNVKKKQFVCVYLTSSPNSSEESKRAYHIGKHVSIVNGLANTNTKHKMKEIDTQVVIREFF